MIKILVWSGFSDKFWKTATTTCCLLSRLGATGNRTPKNWSKLVIFCSKSIYTCSVITIKMWSKTWKCANSYSIKIITTPLSFKISPKILNFIKNWSIYENICEIEMCLDDQPLTFLHSCGEQLPYCSSDLMTSFLLISYSWVQIW